MHYSACVCVTTHSRILMHAYITSYQFQVSKYVHSEAEKENEQRNSNSRNANDKWKRVKAKQMYKCINGLWKDWRVWEAGTTARSRCDWQSVALVSVDIRRSQNVGDTFKCPMPIARNGPVIYGADWCCKATKRAPAHHTNRCNELHEKSRINGYAVLAPESWRTWQSDNSIGSW